MRPKNKPVENKPVKGKRRRTSRKTSEPTNLLADTKPEEVEEILPPPEKNEGMVPSTEIINIEQDPKDLYLTPDEQKALTEYQEARKPELAVETSMAFFQLFLNGYSVDEIHEMNKAFPVEAIHWARLKYGWDKRKDQYITEMHEKIVTKVTKAQLETTNLMTDLLTVTTKKYGDKLKRYLQTGNEKDLEGVMGVQSIAQLLKLMDGLQKITGQANTKRVEQRITKEENVNINTTINGEAVGDLNEDEAAAILSTLASAKRRKERDEK